MVPNFFSTSDCFNGRQFFHGPGRGGFQDDSGALHLLCTLFVILLLQLHLRSSGVRFWRLGTPALGNSGMWRAESAGQIWVRKAYVPGAPFRQILPFALAVCMWHFCFQTYVWGRIWKCGASWPNTNQPNSAAFWGKLTPEPGEQLWG